MSKDKDLDIDIVKKTKKLLREELNEHPVKVELNLYLNQQQNPEQTTIGYSNDSAVAIKDSNAVDDPTNSAVSQEKSHAVDNPNKSAVAQKGNASDNPNKSAVAQGDSNASDNPNRSAVSLDHSKASNKNRRKNTRRKYSLGERFKPQRIF